MRTLGRIRTEPRRSCAAVSFCKLSNADSVLVVKSAFPRRTSFTFPALLAGESGKTEAALVLLNAGCFIDVLNNDGADCSASSLMALSSAAWHEATLCSAAGLCRRML